MLQIRYIAKCQRIVHEYDRIPNNALRRKGEILVIFQELLTSCDYHRIAEIWNDLWPEHEKPLSNEAVVDSLQNFSRMLQGLVPKDTDYVLLAFENHIDGCKSIEAELVEDKAFREKLATIQQKPIPSWDENASEDQLIEFLDKTNGWLPEDFGYEFSPWEEILGSQVLPKNYERMGKDEFIASALYEMSFNGMTREGQDERRAELSDAIAEHDKILDMPPEEREKHLYTLEDVMSRLGYTDDRTEEERREERRQGLLDSVKTRCAWIREFRNIAKDNFT